MTSWQIQAQAVLELRRRQTGATPKTDGDFTRYQQDPHGFCRDVFGEQYTDAVVQVMESVRDNPVTIARSANGTGKSHGAARIAVWFYKCFPGAQVYTTAAPPERNLRKILWGEIGSLVDRHQALFGSDRVTMDLNIQRDALSFITGVSIPMSGTPEQREAKFSGKHSPYLLFIVDEGDAVPPEVYRGIEACMSGGMARLLVMFNPRGEYGPVAQMEKKGQGHVVQLSAFTHPNVVTGEDVIPGAVSREITVRRLNEWTRPLAPDEKPDSECFALPDFLVGATARSLAGVTFPPLPPGQRKITAPSFHYMVLGQYPPQSETQLISRVWIEAAQSRWLAYAAMRGEQPPVDRCVIGQDVAEFGKDWNVACLRYGGWVANLERWNGIDPDATAIRAHGLYDNRGGRLVLVDATGVGAGVAPRMARLGANAVSVKVASAPTYETELGAFFQLRDQLWWSVREWLRSDGGAMLPPDEDLADELATPTYTVQNGKIRVTSKDDMREMLGRSPDRADSLCLTFADDGEAGAEMGVSPTYAYRG